MKFRSRLIFFFFFLAYVQLLKPHLLKRLSFFHWIAFALLLKICQAYLCGSVSTFFSSDPLVYVSIPPPIPHSFITVAIYYVLKLSRVIPPVLFFFLLNSFLAILGPVPFHMNFRISFMPFHMNFTISLSMSTRYLAGILIEIALKQFWRRWHYYCVECSNPWTLCVSPFTQIFFNFFH